MVTDRSQERVLGAERAGHAELRRRRARRNPDGVFREFDTASLNDDVRQVVMQLTQRVDELTGQLDRTRRRVVELETMADEDVLVPVLNRRGFMRELARTIAVINRYQAIAALIVVEVTSLKSINESYGHEVGDTVLRTVAGRIRSMVRASDIVGRVSGEKFGIILLAANAEEAVRKAELLAAELAAPTNTDRGLTISAAVNADATAISAEDAPVDTLGRAARAALPA